MKKIIKKAGKITLMFGMVLTILPGVVSANPNSSDRSIEANVQSVKAIRAVPIKPHNTPVDVIIAWGGPINSLTDITLSEALSTTNTNTKDASQVILSTLSNENEDGNMREALPSRRALKADFSGKVELNGKGGLKLLTPFIFEDSDMIVRKGKNYVSWASTIHNKDFDGIIVRTHKDNRAVSAVSDTARISIKTVAGRDFSKTVQLSELYKKGFIRYNVSENGQKYGVILLALQKPVCETIFARFVSKCTETPVEPTLMPTPEPAPAEPWSLIEPAPTPVNAPVEQAAGVEISTFNYEHIQNQIDLLLQLIQKLQDLQEAMRQL